MFDLGWAALSVPRPSSTNSTRQLLFSTPPAALGLGEKNKTKQKNSPAKILRTHWLATALLASRPAGLQGPKPGELASAPADLGDPAGLWAWRAAACRGALVGLALSVCARAVGWSGGGIERARGGRGGGSSTRRQPGPRSAPPRPRPGLPGPSPPPRAAHRQPADPAARALVRARAGGGLHSAGDHEQRRRRRGVHRLAEEIASRKEVEALCE